MTENEKNKAMPTNQGLQQFATEINGEFDTPLFETMPIADDTARNPQTGVAIPSTMAIDAAKEWVDEGSKL